MPDHLVVPVRIDPTGRAGPTPAQARGRAWRKTSHGFYVPEYVDRTLPEQRILEQSVRLRGGAVTGWASCRMHGAAFFDGWAEGGRRVLPVPLNCGPLHQIRRLPGDDILRDILNPGEIEEIAGVPCTVVERATFDAMRFARHLRAAVQAMDMMAAAVQTSLRRMRGYVDQHPAWTGVQQARDALALADEGSRSPQESALRLIWQLDAGLPRPLVNRPLFDLHGTLLGYPDLLDPVAGLVGEFDGADHRSAGAHSADVDREAGFRRHHLEVVRVTGPDMNHRDVVIERILDGHRRSTFVPPSSRTWTLTPPPWWRAEPSLDDVLDRGSSPYRLGA